MEIPNIEKRSKLYALLKPFVDFYHDWIFNQRFFRLNKQNLPKQGPALVTFTHQCALMDSMMIVSLDSKWQPIHVARADIFAPKLQRKFLFFLKMMPIFRVRDGFRNVKQTWNTFEKASEILRKKQFIVIAPEANHVAKRRVRTLSKGFARMAFKAEEDNDFKLGLKIIPIGLHYEDYYSARISVLANVGEPIDFSDLFDLYKQDQQQALLALRDRVAQAMKKLIIHIEDLDKYDDCEVIRQVGTYWLAQKEGKKVKDEKDRFIFGKKVIDTIRDKIKPKQPELFQKLIQAAREYRQFLTKHKFHDFTVRKDSSLGYLLLKGLWFLLTLPLFLYGFIFNVPMYYVPVWMTSRIKEPSFHTSVRFVHYMFLYPLWYLALFFLSKSVIPDPWYRLAFVISLPIAGFFALSWARGVRKLVEKFRFYFSSHRKRIKQARERVVSLLQNAFVPSV